MKKIASYGFFIFPLLLLCGCSTTFAGTLLVLNFRDLILYVLLAFMFAVLIAFKGSAENRKRSFWIWFILGLILTPLAGFIYLLVQFTKNNKK